MAVGLMDACRHKDSPWRLLSKTNIGHMTDAAPNWLRDAVRHCHDLPHPKGGNGIVSAAGVRKGGGDADE
jgi:hypothetical protein